MASGINKIILLGYLGHAPELRYTPSGEAVAQVRLATAEQWKDKKTGQIYEETEWHRLVFFNPLAEIVRDHLAKGSRIYVEGRVKTRKWQDRQGQERYTVEVLVKALALLDQPVAKAIPPVAPPDAPHLGTATFSSRLAALKEGVL